jgi:hypothetical protein
VVLHVVRRHARRRLAEVAVVHADDARVRVQPALVVDDSGRVQPGPGADALAQMLGAPL